MDHHHHNHHQNMHWGYTTSPPVPAATPSQSHWATPPAQNHSLKRHLSESDCDELYSEESSKEQISPGDPGSCQLMSRKKRRGVIEKKRRDRINSSLSELKRLVPSAYEKQGSAKLEKAEILQLTVEHLKNLHSKGMEALSYDPQRFAMDYHIIGFRECAAEVARYLVTIEGMDIQDPLRLRLMSHLQYFVQQRELSAKSCATTGGAWTSASSTGAYQPNCAVAPYQSYPTATAATHAASTSSYVPNLPTALHPYPSLSTSPNAAHLHQQHHQQQQQQPQQHHHSNSVHVGRSSAGSTTSDSIPISQHTSPHSTSRQSNAQHASHPQTTPTPLDTQHHAQQHYTHDHTLQDHQGATYIELTSSQEQHSRTATATGNISYASASTQYSVSNDQDYNTNGYVTTNGSKPYRPWGAEMAY